MKEGKKRKVYDKDFQIFPDVKRNDENPLSSMLADFSVIPRHNGVHCKTLMIPLGVRKSIVFP